MKKLLALLSLSSFFLAFISSSSVAESKGVSLKDEFKDSFLIGTALNKDQIMGREKGTSEFVAKQFNAVTAENEMKWEKIHPVDGEYSFEVADKLVEYAKKNEMRIIGHALVWHQQTPDWVFLDDSGKSASRELLLQRMEDHISKVVGRYKGVIPEWDVVNEALNEDGSFRESKWYKIIGKDFVEKAFEFAHRADPTAQLNYNDYNLFKQEKRAGVVNLVNDLKKKGITVHGIGMQGHYAIGFPEDLADIDASIKAFSALGTTVMITELDVSVLPFPEEGNQGADLGIDLELQAKLNPYSKGLPRDIAESQEKVYLDIFRIFIENKEKISRVTFWGTSDAHSWRNNWPMKGRTDYPLLFDRKNRPKKALFEIVKMKKTLNL